MCLDCEWLWHAFSRPIAPRLRSGQHSLNANNDATESGAIKGSTSDLHLAAPPEEENDLNSGVGAAIADILQRLSNCEVDEQRTAAAELRFLSKESPERKILIAKAAAIPLLVNLLSTHDPETQEHAVTTLLNLSIINANKEAIVRAGAIDAIVEVLKSGSMEARENAAATLFSLSVLEENKVIIGKSRAFPALVDLLKDGTMRGKNDAASALFNVSLYEANKAKVVSAGIVPPLVKLLHDSHAGMVDVSLEILSLLATHQDGRTAICNASAIPVLVDLIRSGSPGNKENAVTILLALSEHDPKQVMVVRQLGALTLLTELSRTGIPRAKRKASQLLELFNNPIADHDSQ